MSIDIPVVARNALLFLIAMVFLSVVKVTFERFIDLTEKKYSHKTKSFDAERQMPPEWAWAAQPAKSFDAEREALNMNGGNPVSGFEAKTIKYY